MSTKNQSTVTFRWTTVSETAAALLSMGDLSSQKIAGKLGVSRATITRWKATPEFQSRVLGHVAWFQKRFKMIRYTSRARRVQLLNELAEDLWRIIEERGSHHALRDLVGGATGLVVPTIISLRTKDGYKIFKSSKTDHTLVRALRVCLAAIAKETGDRGQKQVEVNAASEKVDTILMTSARIEALAREKQEVYSRDSCYESPMRMNVVQYQVAVAAVFAGRAATKLELQMRIVGKTGFSEIGVHDALDYLLAESCLQECAVPWKSSGQANLGRQVWYERGYNWNAPIERAGLSSEPSPEPSVTPDEHSTDGFEWTPSKEQAACLLAEDELTDQKIAHQEGISRATLAQWKKNREFVARCAAHVARHRERVKSMRSRGKIDRLRRLSDIVESFCTIRRERGRQPVMQTVPGGTTGLVIVCQKELRNADQKQVFTEYRIDMKLIKGIVTTLCSIRAEVGNLEADGTGGRNYRK